MHENRPEYPPAAGSPPHYATEAYAAQLTKATNPVLLGNGRQHDVERPIAQEICRLRETVHVQRKLLEELGERLSPVMSNVPHGDMCKKDDPRPALCQIAEDLRSLGGFVHECNEILRSFMNRMEI